MENAKDDRYELIEELIDDNYNVTIKLNVDLTRPEINDILYNVYFTSNEYINELGILDKDSKPVILSQYEQMQFNELKDWKNRVDIGIKKYRKNLSIQNKNILEDYIKEIEKLISKREDPEVKEEYKKLIEQIRQAEINDFSISNYKKLKEDDAIKVRENIKDLYEIKEETNNEEYIVTINLKEELIESEINYILTNFYLNNNKEITKLNILDKNHQLVELDYYQEMQFKKLEKWKFRTDILIEEYKVDPSTRRQLDYYKIRDEIYMEMVQCATPEIQKGLLETGDRFSRVLNDYTRELENEHDIDSSIYSAEVYLRSIKTNPRAFNIRNAIIEMHKNIDFYKSEINDSLEEKIEKYEQLVKEYEIKSSEVMKNNDILEKIEEKVDDLDYFYRDTNGKISYYLDDVKKDSWKYTLSEIEEKFEIIKKADKYFNEKLELCKKDMEEYKKLPNPDSYKNKTIWFFEQILGYEKLLTRYENELNKILEFYKNKELEKNKAKDDEREI